MSPAQTSERPSSPGPASRFERVGRQFILPNPWNPNRMTADMYGKALESIQLFGFIDPILCREMGDHYQIIDGEHRFRAACDLGYTEFDIVVIDVDDATAKKLTIVMNELHGQADPTKMGDLLNEILADTSLDELIVALPYDRDVLAGYLRTSLPDLPPLASAPPPDAREASGTQWVERLYRLPAEAALMVDEAIEKAKDGEELEQWQGLERVAADYLAS